MRTALATALRLDESRVRVIAPDVGGGFGLKMHVFPRTWQWRRWHGASAAP